VDVIRTIRLLREEAERLDRLIASLERARARQQSEEGKRPLRRGRKGMSIEERRQVSERMKRYWAGRRSALTIADAAPPARAAAAAAGAAAGARIRSRPND
jgi:hypothetical protein